MKRLLTLVAFFATLQASAQQVNPVPDYVFRNQMSVGRNAVTDTAAYFSIGPRYGATKGFMPPIVGDTATFSSGKRNGLLIFSVQKNKFLYWDSVRVQWSDMAGSSGAYIVAGDTASMLAPYLRKADTTSMLTAYLRKADTSSMLTNYVRHAGFGLTKSGQSFIIDTLNIATRAWRQKGLDSLAALEVSGSGTTNYVAKFTASTTLGNSQIYDDGTNVSIGTTSPNRKFHVVQSSGDLVRFETQDSTRNGILSMIHQKPYQSGTFRHVGINFTSPNGNEVGSLHYFPSDTFNVRNYFTIKTPNAGGTTVERFTILQNGYIGVSTTSPYGQFTISNITNNLGGINFGEASNAASRRWQLRSDVAVFGDFSIRQSTTQTGTTFADVLYMNAAAEVFINTATDNGDFKLQVNGNALISGDIRTAAPAGGTANDWRLGTVATVSPTSPNRTIEVSIGGTIYYIHAKTTND